MGHVQTEQTNVCNIQSRNYPTLIKDAVTTSRPRNTETIIQQLLGGSKATKTMGTGPHRHEKEETTQNENPEESDLPRIQINGR